MAYNQTRCRDVCVQSGYDNGELYVDGEVCPFQYFCNCLCAEFNNQTCFDECGTEGRIPMPGITSVLHWFLYAHFAATILIKNGSFITEQLQFLCFFDERHKKWFRSQLF